MNEYQMFCSTQKVAMFLCPYNRMQNMWQIFQRGIITVPSDLNLVVRRQTGNALFLFSFHLCVSFGVSLLCSTAEPVHPAHLCFTRIRASKCSHSHGESSQLFSMCYALQLKMFTSLHLTCSWALAPKWIKSMCLHSHLE